jgi:hypothetical protein
MKTLLCVVDHARSGLAVEESVRARSDHAAHANNAGNEALRSRIGGEGVRGGQLRGIVVIHHAVNLLSDQVWPSASAGLPVGLRAVLLLLSGCVEVWRLALLRGWHERGCSGGWRHAASGEAGGIVETLLGLHDLVRLVAVVALLRIGIRLERNCVDSPLGYLRKRCAGGMLTGVGWLARMLLRIAIRDLQGHLLVEGLLIRLRIRMLGESRRFDIGDRDGLLRSRLMHR